MRRSIARSNASASRCAVTSNSQSRVNGRFGFSAKVFNRSELARRQTLFTAVGRVDQHAPFQIENAAADAHARALGRRPGGPPQYALDTRQQLARFKWLRDVIVGAAFESHDTIDGIAGSGYHDDANAA